MTSRRTAHIFEPVDKKLTSEQLYTRMREAASLAPIGSIWTHVRNGEKYVVTDLSLHEDGLIPVVVYKRSNASDNGYVRFARDLRNFLDRFNPVMQHVIDTNVYREARPNWR